MSRRSQSFHLEEAGNTTIKLVCCNIWVKFSLQHFSPSAFRPWNLYCTWCVGQINKHPAPVRLNGATWAFFKYVIYYISIDFLNHALNWWACYFGIVHHLHCVFLFTYCMNPVRWAPRQADLSQVVTVRQPPREKTPRIKKELLTLTLGDNADGRNEGGDDYDGWEPVIMITSPGDSVSGYWGTMDPFT